MTSAEIPKDLAYVVLVGDVGCGKSTILEKLTGLTGFSSNSSTSYTVESNPVMISSLNLIVCDTPGSNAMSDKLNQNLWIAEAINYYSVSRIMIVVKADTRIDNVIAAVRRYAEGFLDLPHMEELMAVLLTHTDRVKWPASEMAGHLYNELGLDTVISSGLHTKGKGLAREIRAICTTTHDINVNDYNFLKFFNISNNNVKIIRSTKREVSNIKTIYEQFVYQRRAFDQKDQTDLIFEFHTWMQDRISVAQQRVGDENGFSFYGQGMMNEIGHIANMTNQLRAILFDVRTELIGCQSNHGVTDLRRCPHCGLVWCKISGCNGQTRCGMTESNPDIRSPEYNVLGTFSFNWNGGRLVIGKSGQRSVNKTGGVKTGGVGIGCGRAINWNNMAPVKIPSEFSMSQNVTVDDVPLVPQNARASWYETFTDIAQSIKNRFAKRKI